MRYTVSVTPFCILLVFPMNTPLVISFIFATTFLLGKALEKIRIPWIFSALIIGIALSVKNPFIATTSSETFSFLAEMGMYFLLFLIGLEVDFKKLASKGRFLVTSSFFIIFLEGIVGSLFIHWAFGYSWNIAFLVALSFATVGEAILVPILDEFKIINTTLGHTIIGIGTVDDIIEIFTLLLVSIIVGTNAEGSITTVLSALGVLMVLTIGFTRLSSRRDVFRFLSIESLFLFVLAVFFLFVGVGSWAAAAPLAAILAGFSLRAFLPPRRLEKIEGEIKAVAYGLFAPLFFVKVGSELNVHYLLQYPLLVFAIVAVANGAKMLGGYIIGARRLGGRGSILLGIGLSVRFSTSIVIIKILLDHGIINTDVYSVIVASSIIFTLVIPLLFSHLLFRWGYVKSKPRAIARKSKK